MEMLAVRPPVAETWRATRIRQQEIVLSGRLLRSDTPFVVQFSRMTAGLHQPAVAAGARRVIRELQPGSDEHRGGETALNLREVNHQTPRFGWALYGRTLGSSGMKNRHA
jgi:hypothetical protein